MVLAVAILMSRRPRFDGLADESAGERLRTSEPLMACRSSPGYEAGGDDGSDVSVESQVASVADYDPVRG